MRNHFFVTSPNSRLSIAKIRQTGVFMLYFRLLLVDRKKKNSNLKKAEGNKDENSSQTKNQRKINKVQYLKRLIKFITLNKTILKRKQKTQTHED